MYKTTQDSVSYLERSASHSARPFANGHISDIPEWAAAPEEYYNSLKARYESLSEQLRKTRERASWIRKCLRNTLPHEEYERVQHELDYLSELQVSLETESSHYRALARAAGFNAWGIVYYLCAQKLIEDGQLRRAIEENVQEWLGRKRAEISKGALELTDEQRTKDNRRGQLRKRRRRFREERGPEKKYVWREG